MKKTSNSRNLVLMLAVMFSLTVLTNCKTTEAIDPPEDLIIMGTWNQTDTNVELNVGSQTLVEYLVEQGQSLEDAEAYVNAFLSSSLVNKMDLNSDHTYTFYIDQTNVGTGMWVYNISVKTVTDSSNKLLFNVVFISDTDMILQQEGAFMYTDETIGLIEIEISFHIEDAWVKL